MAFSQLSFDGFQDNSTLSGDSGLEEAVQVLAGSKDPASRGAVSTQAIVVEFILNLIGYTPDKKLFKQSILEPSFGDGDFLFVIIKRLLESWHQHNKGVAPPIIEALANSLRAVEIHHKTYHKTKRAVLQQIQNSGFSPADAEALASRWLVQGDFLLMPLKPKFDFVVGNPPYLRQEALPRPLVREYRQRYSTMYDRADLYIPFFQKSLQLLQPFGKLGFICSDRWMKNRYGGPLRRLIAESFNLSVYVDMTATDSFVKDVAAYPAITIIGKEQQGVTRIAHRPSINRSNLGSFARQLNSGKGSSKKILEISGVVNGGEPWLFDCTERLALLRRLEKGFPTLEEAGCKVGIGVATGADKIYIGNHNELPVEEDLKLPLVRTEDLVLGQIEWHGNAVINPFDDGGSLVDLGRYPKLAAYLNTHADVIKKRHVARKNPAQWYRTIDRIYPELLSKHKLLVPDIKGQAHFVYDAGNYYPHHNLYYITSTAWDLRALQAILLSSIGEFFVRMYSTKIRGDYLRFQAQYLRRIRVPHWEQVSSRYREKLVAAARSRDVRKCNQIVFQLYGLNPLEVAALEGGKNCGP